MMEDAIVKNGEVEVFPDEEGFRGAYFRAILEENPTKSGRKKLRVRYTTLLNDDGSTLTEMLDQNLIRPVPPVGLYKDDVVLDEGSVVDADYKDGWWTGVVIKKSQDENEFIVHFDSPPDIIQFDRNQIRPHFDWTGWKWVRPEIKELSKSEFSPGTMVEVNSVMDKDELVWLPAMIIKELDEGDDDDDDDVNEKKKRFIVKDCNHRHNSRPNATVDACRVRPTPSLPLVEQKYKLMERVEAFRYGLGWRQGIVRVVLSDNRYMVSLEATKEESVFKHPNIRPFQVWEDGVWKSEPKVKKTPLGKKKLKPKCSVSSSSLVYKPVTPRTRTRSIELTIRRSLNPETVVTESGECGKKKQVDTDVVTKRNDKASVTTPVKESLTAKESETVSEESGKKKASLFHKAFKVKTPQVTSIEKESVTPLTPSPLKQTDVETEGLKSPEKTLDEPANDPTQSKVMEEEENNQDKGEEEEHNISQTDETSNGSNAEIIDTMTKEVASPEKTLEPVNDPTQSKMMDEEENNHDKGEEEEEEQNISQTDETCNVSNAEINDTMTKEFASPEKTLEPVTDSIPNKMMEEEDNNQDKGEEEEEEEEDNNSEIDAPNAETNDTISPSPVTPEIPMKETEAETHEKTLEPVNNLGNDSTQSRMPEEEEEENSEGESRKRKRQEEHNISETDETSNAEINDTSKEIVSPVTPSPLITVTPTKQTEAETHEKTPEPVNGLVNDSTRKMPEEENNEDESRKRKREHNNSETDGSCDASDAEINDTSQKFCNYVQPLASWIRNLSTELSPSTEARDITSLPFEKKSPFWKTCESTESFKSLPQSPHFSPLSEANEDVREWTAVGMMVTFYGLLDEVKALKPDDASIERLHKLNDSFSELEKHGFEVVTLQTQISKMLSLKERRERKAEERKGFQIMIDEEESQKRKFGEERADMARLILMLKKAEAAAKEKEEASEKKVVEMKTSAETIDQEIEDIDLEFQNIVSAPWCNNN